MPTYGDKWVGDMIVAIQGGPKMSTARAAAAVSQLEAMVALLNAQQPAPTPPPPVVSSIFAQPGWFAVRYDKLPSPAALADAGVKWVAAILSHGIDGAGGHSLDTDDKENQAWLADGKAFQYRNLGIKVGGWGWQQGFHAVDEASVAETYIRAWSLDLWIANGEEAWKGNDQPDLFAAQLAPGVPASSCQVAWSTLGAASGTNVFPFHYAAFTNRGWPILAQSYPQETGDYKLSKCVDHAERAGIPLRLFHYTIANYEAVAGRPTAYKPTMAEWEAEMRAAAARGVHGVSFWSHDWNVADVDRLAAVS